MFRLGGRSRLGLFIGCVYGIWNMEFYGGIWEFVYGFWFDLVYTWGLGLTLRSGHGLDSGQ